MGAESAHSPQPAKEKMNIRVGILTAPHIEHEPAANGFRLHNVRIGIGFHWDREEDQTFEGKLEITDNADGTQTAVNVIDIEDYLCSVISSEMNADSPMELLKAHAVMSRSWAIRAIAANRTSASRMRQAAWESNGHKGFDVCADDHCQRYEGTRRMNSRAVEAVRATQGEVLTYGGEVCDARFHKCCGGRTELFETCWEDVHVPYLEPVDCPWCGTKDERVLRNVLNDYDRETKDFHDWEVRYTQEELSDIVRSKSGTDFGTITDLRPLHRGASGRIDRLEIAGTKRTETIGKELKIRRTLSRSCLYSSWFDVEREGTDFVLRGHGWGHGAGLCQIGAAVMADKGFNYKEILAFYYKGAEVSRHTRQG
ncbi:MAG: SpoIID/LytB domain-containing protein [Paludibacteraceae bacterium]|nr:SpoIID/LytB domain-containing protein [Paludibacteraceae bacterium]